MDAKLLQNFQNFLLEGLQESETNWAKEEERMVPMLSWKAMGAIAYRKAGTTNIKDLFPMIGLIGSVMRTENSLELECSLLDSPDSLGVYSCQDDSNESFTGNDSQEEMEGAEIMKKSGLQVIDPVFLNINSPWSIFLCGSQGSGKSHTLSCILESCLLSHPSISFSSAQPLSGLVFHYENSQGNSIAEAANLCSHTKVRVLVSPTNHNRLAGLYGALPNAAENLTVKPFYLKSKHLTTERMLQLMGIDSKDKEMPLYMAVVLQILREMASEHKGSLDFDWRVFRRRIEQSDLLPSQLNMLNLRCNVVESFLEGQELVKQTNKFKKVRNGQDDPFKGNPGELIIVDLTDPILDPETVCVLFDLALNEYVNRSGGGKIVALDEAHNYMREDSVASAAFTQNLIRNVRQQRHRAMRVVVATQEPTINDMLLDLCTITFVHRFTSPAWFEKIRKHLVGALMLDQVETDNHEDNPQALKTKLLKDIVKLRVGESLLFGPTTALGVDDSGRAKKMHEGHVKFRTRLRITRDGGKSQLAVSDSY